MRQHYLPIHSLLILCAMVLTLSNAAFAAKNNIFPMETLKVYCEKQLGTDGSSFDALKKLEASLRADSAKKTADQLATIRNALENGHEIEIGLQRYSPQHNHRGKIERIEVTEWRDMRPREDVRVTVSGKTFSLNINPPDSITAITKK